MKEFTLNDMLRLGAENSTLKARISTLEKERDERLTDRQVEAFAGALFFEWAVWYHDQQTRGRMEVLLRQLRGEPPLSVSVALREYRRFKL